MKSIGRLRPKKRRSRSRRPSFYTYIYWIEEDLDAEKEDSYTAQILAMNQELSLATYFTEEERSVLSKYFIEQDMTEDTFVASDVDTSVSGSSITLDNSAVSVSGSIITMVDLDAPYSKEMYMLAGGVVFDFREHRSDR